METLTVDENMKVYKGGGCNSIVLNSKDGRKAVVVDTKYFRGAKELRKKVTADEVTIINTHFHIDHARGNRLYLGTTIVSGSTNWKQWDFDTAHSKRPDKALSPGDTLDLEFDGEIIHVIDLGQAHSPNDIVVYFEKRQVLAAGDLVWVKMHPVLLDGNTKLNLWKGYLDRLDRNYKIEIVVPGHGEVSGRAAIIDMKDYFGSITAASVAAGTASQGRRRPCVAATLSSCGSHSDPCPGASCRPGSTARWAIGEPAHSRESARPHAPRRWKDSTSAAHPPIVEGSATAGCRPCRLGCPALVSWRPPRRWAPWPPRREPRAPTEGWGRRPALPP